MCCLVEKHHNRVAASSYKTTMPRSKSITNSFSAIERQLAEELKRLDEKRAAKAGSEFEERLKALVLEYHVDSDEVVSALSTIRRGKSH